MLAQGLYADELQQGVCRVVQDPDEGVEDEVKRPQRQGDKHGRALGILHGKRFGSELAKNYVQSGDREKRRGERYFVNELGGQGNIDQVEKRFENI